MNDSSVTQKVTARLKLLVPESLKHLVSSKCLRIGSSTAMAADPLVTYDQSIIRGGWSTGTSRDYYVWVVLFALLAPMMSLAGHPDPKAMPYPPRLNAIPFQQHDTIQTFIRFLYIINVPYFLPGGKLRPMMEECTAVLIMHFPYTIRKYGRDDKLTTKMIEAGISAGLGATANEVIIRLREWAKLIQDDYDNQKTKPSDHRDEIIARLLAIQRTQAADNASQREQIRMLTSQLADNMAELTSFKQAVATDIGELKGLIYQLLGHRGGISAERRRISASPENPTAPVPPATITTAVGNLIAASTAAAGNMSANEDAAISGRATASAAPALAVATQQPNTQQRPTQLPTVNAVLWHGARATSANKGDEGIDVSKVVEALYKMDCKPLSLLKRNRPLKYLLYQHISSNNKSKYESAMTLVEALMTTQQRKVAIEGELAWNEAASVFVDLDSWVKRATAVMHGKTTVAASRRASWIGIGGSIKAAKKTITGADMTAFVAEFIPHVEWEQLKNASDGDIFLARGKTETFRQWVNSQLARNKGANP
jgi:hypothetical protein